MVGLRGMCLMLSLGVASACGSETTGGDAPPAEETPLQGTVDGLVAQNPDTETGFTLTPVVVADGETHTAVLPCDVEDQGVRCQVGELGSVLVRALEGSTLEMDFTATDAVVFEGMGLQGQGSLEGATSWLSNGFQSWSQSGVVALGPTPADADLASALALRGDDEVLRKGRAQSWWFTYVGGGDETLVAGALSAQRFRSWTQSTLTGDGELLLRLVSGGTGEALSLGPGETVAGERWYLALGEDAHGLLESYGAALPSRQDDGEVAPAPAGWNSWYQLWDAVDEEAVRANAETVVEILGAPADAAGRALFVVVDDGWQLAWGDWLPNEKFPSGMDGLASDLKADGFQMGIWLAPLLVDADHGLVEEHPQWFIGEASWNHPVHGAMRILDVSHPEAAAHLKETIATIVSWGFDLLKIDFLFAGTFDGVHHEAGLTGMGHYARALELLREAAGEETILVAVGAPSLETFQWVDGWRIGYDIAVEPFGAAWGFVPNQLRSVGARWPLCQAVLCDADPPLLRDLPRPEVEVGVWIAALAGGAMFLSDDLRGLPEERWGWLGADAYTLGTDGASAVPLDLFPEEAPEDLADPYVDHLTAVTNHITPQRWRLQDGRLLGINVSDEELSLGETTLAPHTAGLLDP